MNIVSIPELTKYKFHTEEITWTEAKSQCKADGGYLAVINSEEEAKLIDQLFEINMEYFYAHIGFYRHPFGAPVTIFGKL